jgi:hypothetical protein
MTGNTSFDSQLLVPFDSKMKVALAHIANVEERSMTAQARYFILQGMRLAAEQDILDEIEGNAVPAS